MTIDSPGAIVAVAAAWLVIAALALLPAGNAFAARRLAFPLGALIGLALSALGLQAIWLPAAQLTLPLGLPDLPFHLRVDPLAGFFLMLLGSVSAGISVYAAGYFRDETAGRLALIGLQYHVFLASMAFVILADDAYLFMVAWETMALSSYFLVTTDHKLPAVRSAGFLYLLIAHLGALAILLCFGVMHGGHGDYTFDALRSAQLDPRWATVAFLLAFFGFGAKAGMIPLHAWLPEAHPAAPSPVSALMSGIMLKTAIYGMVRVIYDLIGVVPQGDSDQRKWLRHGAWPGGVFPLRKEFDLASSCPPADDHYPFVKVEGEGVHEIPVGPVHAGTIEPGHFRFSIVGEKILRLEQRLGYKHKGIEKRFETMTLEEGAKLAGRVSGDSTVAYAWAWAMAVEGATGTEPTSRSLVLRGILLELERIANHLGDLGYLGNDVALSFGFFQFWRLKEDLLRLNAELFGHRYLMDLVVPGGVARDLPRGEAGRLLAGLASIEREVATLRSIYDEHAGAQDRFIMTGQVLPELAEKMGLTGFAGRASGVNHDLRADFPIPPWQQLPVRVASHIRGDVAARVSVRFDEVSESMRLVRGLVHQLPLGEVRVPVLACPGGRRGVGWVEGWRGEVLIALETAEASRIYRAHPHDPSWQNWPLLERAVMGNIVPDFPLINKSFNLSYSGQDV